MICIFQFSVVPWEMQRTLPHTSGLSSSSEEHSCLDRMHSPTAKHLLYLHPANCLKLKSWLSLPRECKRKIGVVTCHAQVPSLIPLHQYSLKREESQVRLTARSWSSSLSGQRTAMHKSTIFKFSRMWSLQGKKEGFVQGKSRSKKNFLKILLHFTDNGILKGVLKRQVNCYS